MPLKWTKAAILAEALKHKTRCAFKAAAGRAYRLASEGGFLQEACAHMDVVRKRWTMQELIDEALEYETRGDFMEGSPAAYHTAHRRKVIDKVCAHMPENVSWTLEALNKEARKYKTRGDFALQSNSAYVVAHRKGWITKVCAHMVPANRKVPVKWTRAAIQAEADKHSTRLDFSQKSPLAYSAAQKLGIIDEVCANIPAQHFVFNRDKRAFVYYVRIETETLRYPLYKIGVTNGSVAHRFRSEKAVITEIMVWEHKIGRAALAQERELLMEYADHNYIGKAVLNSNGNTELFTKDILGLDGKKLTGFRSKKSA